MNDWIQFHNPDVMGTGIDDLIGSQLSIVSDRAVFPYEGLRIWLVGRRATVDLEIYLGGSMVVDGIRASAHPKFLYEYFGTRGTYCDPLPGISGEAWYPDLLKVTGNFRFGLTELRSVKITTGLQALADKFTVKRGRPPR